MKKINVQPIIDAIIATVKSHEIKETPGAYRRWLWQDGKGTRELGINPYGCADAINLLYTVGDFYAPREVRAARISVLKSLQDPKTGMFRESTHHTIHTTAHCTGALELFDERPDYPLYELHKYFDKSELYALLDTLLWREDIWPESHKGAGVYAALVNSGEITPEFSENYFSWLDENCDEVTGFWRRGVANKAPVSSERYIDGAISLFGVMAGGFHFMFNHEYAKRPLLYPERIIDSEITLYRKGGLPDYFMKSCHFIEVDFIYCMTRAMRKTSHRRQECLEILTEIAEKFTDYLLGVDYKTDDSFNDLHMLFGASCALAELQSALPGMIISDKPMRLVLDRRPFI